MLQHRVVFYAKMYVRYIQLLWISILPECVLQQAMDAAVLCDMVDWGVYSKHDGARTFWFIYFNSIVTDEAFTICNVAALQKLHRMRAFEGALVFFAKNKRIEIATEPIRTNAWLIDDKKKEPLFGDISLI